MSELRLRVEGPGAEAVAAEEELTNAVVAFKKSFA